MKGLHSKLTEFKIVTYALANHMTVEMTAAIFEQMQGHATPEVTKEKTMAWVRKNMPDQIEAIEGFIDLINEGFYNDTEHHKNN